MLDQVTGGRFILGLGAGWHEGEHEAFGIPLPPIASASTATRARCGCSRRCSRTRPGSRPGVTLDDPFYPLRGATNEPSPVDPGGPPILLGGQKRRGIELATRVASGWPMPGTRLGDVAYFAERRDAISRALEAAGRDPDAFTFAGQLSCGSTPPTGRPPARPPARREGGRDPRDPRRAGERRPGAPAAWSPTRSPSRSWPRPG